MALRLGYTMSVLALAAIILAADIAVAAAQGNGPADRSTELRLTPAQRTRIFETVARDKDKVRLPREANPQVSIGAQMPAWIELYVLPDDISAEVPAIKFYQYTIVQDQVVIVDPTKMTVVDLIRQ
jgi:uncharacterized protein DUF1236